MVLPWWTRLAVLAGLVVSVWAWGDIHGHKTEQAKAAAEKLDYEQKANAALLASQARGNALTAQLQAARSSITKVKQEKQRAILALTDNRKCFDGAALGLLNARPDDKGNLSSPASSAAGKGGASTAASDRDVANWIIDARSRYADCAARLNALIDFTLPK